MKRFVKIVITFIAFPIVLLAILYLITDPFKTLNPFSLQYFDTRNRDYLSSELFLANYPQQQYNSFIFGSSRACGINSYHWKHYLPKNSNQFVFQSWAETLTGIEQKIDYIDSHNIPINNALILFDIPGSFAKRQEPIEAIKMKDYHISGKSFFHYQLFSFYNFAQKPSIWIQTIKERNITHREIPFDTISNDWSKLCRTLSYEQPPEKDSLNSCSRISKETFLQSIKGKAEVETSEEVINATMKNKLLHIKQLLDKNSTDYYIIITPAFCYSHSQINPSDLSILQKIFGKDRVFNYSGKNNLTSDYNNYSDPNHFGLFVGWHIIEDIYNK